MNDVPVTVPQSGWKAFPSQDLNLPSLFNYGIALANTCPVDNCRLMIFQALVKSGRIDLDDLAGAGNVIKTALSLMDRQEYRDAKLACLPTGLAIKKGVIDLYGNEADYLLKIIQQFCATAVTSCCFAVVLREINFLLVLLRCSIRGKRTYQNMQGLHHW